MQVGARKQSQLSSPLVTLRPIRFSLLKIVTAIGLSVLFLVLLWLGTPQGSILLLFILVSILFLLNITNHSLLLTLFYTVQLQDSDDIVRYAANDLSYRSADEDSRKTNHVFIVKVHYIKEGAKYFYFKEELYSVDNGVVSTLNQADIIKVLGIKDFKEYLRFGLSDERLRISQQLFKSQTKYLKPTTWSFLSKRIQNQIGIIIFNCIFLVAAALIVESIALTILLLALNGAIFGLFIFDQSSKVAKFNQKFYLLTSKRFKALRGQNNTVQISLSQVLVGDIIEIDRSGEQDEYMTTFSSLLIGNFQVICKEGPNRDESIKSPVRDVADVREDRKVRFVIQPLSYIQKASLRGNEYLIVVQNNSTSKFFALWFQKGRYAEFHSISRGKIWKAIKVYIYGTLIRVLIHLIVAIIFHNSTIPFHPEIEEAMTISTFLLPAIIHLLFTWGNHRALKQLNTHNIEVFDSDIPSAGTLSNMVINFSELLELQFQEILYKNLIFDPSSRTFEPDDTTLQNGRTYESLLAIILYLSLGYYDEQERKSTFLKHLFKLFQSYFTYEDTLDDTKDIVHNPTGKMWKLIGKDLENEEGLRSWRIQYEHQLKYVLTEFSVKNEQNFTKYIGAEDQNRSAIYISLAESLIEEGKKLKLLMFKSFKKETANIRQTQIIHQTRQQFMEVDRSRLQKNMEFAAFVVFDNALKTGNQKIIQYLRDIRNDNGAKIFNLAVYSHNRNQSLAGFEHILEYIPIYYSFRSHEKTAFVRQKMGEGGTMTVGSDSEDQYAQLISDVSIRINQAVDEDNKIERVTIPADIFINRLEDLRVLLTVGMVQAQYQIEILKYTFLVWFWMNFGWVYTGGRGDDHVVDHSPLWAIILSLLFIFLPLFVHSLFKDSRSLKNYNRFMDAFTVSYAIHILLSILVMIFVIIMSDNNLCTLHGMPKEAHMLTFRSHHHDQSYICTNIPIVLTGSTSLITFVVFQGEKFYNSSFQWWRFSIPLIWFILMIIAAVPFKLILLSIVIMALLIIFKVMVKFLSSEQQEKELKQSQNVEIGIEEH